MGDEICGQTERDSRSSSPSMFVDQEGDSSSRGSRSISNEYSPPRQIDAQQTKPAGKNGARPRSGKDLEQAGTNENDSNELTELSPADIAEQRNSAQRTCSREPEDTYGAPMAASNTGGEAEKGHAHENGSRDCSQERCATCDRPIHITEQLISRLRQLIKNLEQKIEGQAMEINKLKKEKAVLEKSQSGKNSQGKHTPMPGGPQRRGGLRTWHRLLRALINPGHSDDSEDENKKPTWKAVQRMCAREENYSLRLLHPHISGFVAQSVGSDTSNDWSPVSPEKGRVPFTGVLPDKVVARILHHYFVFDHKLVHVLTRLDPKVQPQSFPVEGSAKLSNSSGLTKRFYISGEVGQHISLRHDTISPAELLTPLCVSRKWNYYGASLFYGSNTFAFSSFGEFDKFCNGIGSARVQRIAHMELNWAGSMTVRWVDENNPKDRLDSRVAPLAWLAEMSRLQTLCIFIDESSKEAVRRPFEPQELKIYTQKMTAGQPNARMYRNIRACRGLDWICSLRGLSFVHFYDSNKMLVNKNRLRSRVRDRSAVIDINRTARMAKTRTRARLATLPHLDPLFKARPGQWEADEAALSLIQKMYDQNGPFDLRKNDLDADYDPRRGSPPASDAESHNGDVLDDSSDSGSISSPSSSPCPDSGSGRCGGNRGLPTPPASFGQSLRGRRASTPAPTPDQSIPIASSEDDESGDGTETASSNSCGVDGEVDVDKDNETKEAEDQLRRRRTTEFVQGLRRADEDRICPLSSSDGSNPQLRRARSEGNVSGIIDLEPPQNIQLSPSTRRRLDHIISANDEDDDLQIVENPPPGMFPYRPPQRLSANIRRESSSIFCTPDPNAMKSESRTSETVTPTPSPRPEPESCAAIRAQDEAQSGAAAVHIDLTLDESADEAEDEHPRTSPSPDGPNSSRNVLQPSFGPGSRVGERRVQSVPRGQTERTMNLTEDRDNHQAVHLSDQQRGSTQAGSSDRQQQGMKRTRDGNSVGRSEPDEGTKKRLKAHPFGPPTKWIWLDSYTEHN